MKSIQFHPDAETELIESAAWYESKQKNLGKRFIDTITSATVKIKNNPEIFQQISAGVRRCLVPHFPYGIIFRDRQSGIEIVALVHLHREPGYWIQRLED